MRLMQMGGVLENAARMAGFDPETVSIPGRWRVLAAMAVNGGLRKIYAEKFGMLKRIEFRRYRPEWSATTTWSAGQECWHNGEYWVLASGSTGTTEPGTTGSGWTVVPMEFLKAFVAFEQPWENTAIDPGGVDRNAFAYEQDPKTFPDAMPIGGCGWFEDAVLLPSPAPKGVYCKFMPRAPRVSFTEWSSEASYAAGAGCYMTSTKDCYLATVDVAPGGDNPSVSTTGAWARVRVPDVFETYLTELASAAIVTEDQGKYQTLAAADKELEDLRDRYIEYVGDNQANVGRWYNR